ncbi:hypothetical protein BOTBODRAFT_34436 [Botryobasidium botryosum FD-172 SS1]|uniref:Uncharacterized protein n=1 Tax=Botryobasidium botryosum (strain FD-172 SS1) TaxID=930990 RepID=A0A067M9M5_BOTB1|nr:hypothetical protein BOTBODRAFT_34436 [Botryobasidium botryosum FD-172 SS1]
MEPSDRNQAWESHGVSRNQRPPGSSTPRRHRSSNQGSNVYERSRRIPGQFGDTSMGHGAEGAQDDLPDYTPHDSRGFEDSNIYRDRPPRTNISTPIERTTRPPSAEARASSYQRQSEISTIDPPGNQREGDRVTQSRGSPSYTRPASPRNRQRHPGQLRPQRHEQPETPGLLGRFRDVIFGEVYQTQAVQRRQIEALEENLGSLQVERTELASQFQEAEQEVASLRNHLQIIDSREVREVVQVFRDIKLQIKNVCITLAAHLTDMLSQSSQNSSDYDMPSIQQILTNGASLHQLLASDDYSLEDFLEYALRFSISSKLLVDIFDRFHPKLRGQEDASMLDIYEKIRLKEPQVASARWRSTTFAALSDDNASRGPETSYSGSFVNEFETNVLAPLLTSLCGSWKPEMLPDSSRAEILDIARKAYQWNSDVKLDFFQLDLHPVLFHDTMEFDSSTMVLDDEKYQKMSPRKGPIIASVGLGLRSAMSLGAGKPVDVHWKEKVEVLLDQTIPL